MKQGKIYCGVISENHRLDYQYPAMGRGSFDMFHQIHIDLNMPECADFDDFLKENGYTFYIVDNEDEIPREVDSTIV